VLRRWLDLRLDVDDLRPGLIAMKRLHFLLASVLVSGAAGCGGGGPRDAHDVQAAQANATCAKLFQCKSSYPDGEAAFTDIFGATEADCRALFLMQDVSDIEASIEAGRIIVDENNVNSCIAWVNGLTCEQVWDQNTQEPDACNGFYTPLVNDGDMCTIDEDCLSDFCDQTSMTCNAG